MRRSRPSFLFVIALASVACHPGFAQEKQPLAEDVFKNIQVMKGIPVNQFMDTMGFFAAALGLNCTGCHVAESLTDWDQFGKDIPRKNTSRRMIRMVETINKTQFGGRRAITCWSCHRGTQAPQVVPSLMEQYSIPPEDANAIEIAPDGPTEPTATQILDRYIQESGGASRLAQLTSLVAKGTIEGYDTYQAKVPVEIYGKAPAQRTMIWHTQNGDSAKPLRLMPMSAGAELDGGKFDAAILFPGGIKNALTQWRTGFPVTSIEEKSVNVIQGAGAGGTRFKLYFDVQTGFLTRHVRYTDTLVGMVPTQVDYGDYREVAGVKLPFEIIITWTNGRSVIHLTEVQPNAAIDASRFNKPPAATVKSVRRQ